jgi:co-chaperonin GroES (HSP10)
MLMQHFEDPAKTIWDRIGNLDGFEVFGNSVLLAIYIRPKVTKSGIMLADQTIKEDEWQGKAALVVKLGPSAFVSDRHYDFHGQSLKVGDWVCINVSDGKSLVVNKTACRLIADQYIKMRIPAPDVVF